MAQGYITEIKHDPNGRFGPSWQILVDGKTTGFQKFQPKGVAVGDYITYDVKMNGQYENMVPGSMAKIDPPAGVSAPAAKAPSVIAMDRQDVISRQAALNSALSFVEILQVAGALPEGKTLSAAKKADKIEAIVMEYVQKFHLLSTGAPYEIPEEAVAGSAQSWDEQE